MYACTIYFLIKCFYLSFEEEVDPEMISIPIAESSPVIPFTYHSNTQMFNILNKTAEECSHISRTYSIGQSFENKDLLVIEFSSNPGEHELCKLFKNNSSKMIQ